jgi:hypothetical protein
MKTPCKALWLVFCLFLFCPVPAQAEHTPEHRFTIYGYVYDDRGKPLPGTVVIRDAADHVLGTTDSGRSGYYQIQLHLHNSNVGDKLLIQSEAGKKELIVQFDPNDMTTERKAEVNFGMVPPSSGLFSNGAFLFGAVAMIIVGTIYFVRQTRKRQKRDRVKKKGKGQSKV